MMNIEQRTMRRVMLRIAPFAAVCFFVAYLDRVNVSFAALQMNKDIGLSSSQYGLGAGLFFLSYLFFEVPSNLMLHKFGARRWIARIMLTWGICSTAMALVKGPVSFNIGRMILGAAEAGFNPGMLFYFTLWFPLRYRARVGAYLYAAVPMSFVIGAPISGMLLGLDGFGGLRGWQWLYVTEGLPAMVLSLCVLRWLTDRPAEATWLREDERAWLCAELAQGLISNSGRKLHLVTEAITDPRLIGLCFVYFADVALNNSISFFLPQIVKSFGVSNIQTGFISAVPSVFATAAVILWAKHSDARGERRWHTALALLAGGGGLICSTLVKDPVLRIFFLSVASSGCLAFQGVFWPIPGAFLTGRAAAGGMAAISAVGIFGGFVAPTFIGYVKDYTGSFAAGQQAMGMLTIATAIGLVFFTRVRRHPADPAAAKKI